VASIATSSTCRPGQIRLALGDLLNVSSVAQPTRRWCPTARLLASVPWRLHIDPTAQHPTRRSRPAEESSRRPHAGNATTPTSDAPRSHLVRCSSRTGAPDQLRALTRLIGPQHIDHARPGLRRPPDRAAIRVDRPGRVDRAQVVPMRVRAKTAFAEDNNSPPYRGIAGFNHLPSRWPVAEEPLHLRKYSHAVVGCSRSRGHCAWRSSPRSNDAEASARTYSPIGRGATGTQCAHTTSASNSSSSSAAVQRQALPHLERHQGADQGVYGGEVQTSW
jgi:hypothetical protein